MSREGREIKFRAFVKRLNIVTDVLSIDWRTKTITWDDNQYDRCDPPNKYFEIENMENVVLIQNTGLKDKNGKEIFEGDIIEVETNVQKFNHGVDSMFDEPEFIDVRIKAEVVYREELGAFDLETIEKDPYLDSWGFYGPECPNELKVIGNIHENSELLTENKTR